MSVPHTPDPSRTVPDTRGRRIRHALRRTVACSAATAVLCGAIAGGAGIASAGDGRPPGADGEIAAQFRHALDREPDAAGLANYRSGVDALGCEWGVVDATYRIATSGEAVARWSGDAGDLAGMLYAALLDREPDAQGLADYTASIEERGLALSTAEMLGSAEYRGRLARACGSDDGLSASMYDWRSAMDVAEDLVDKSVSLGASCGALTGIKKLTGLKKGSTGPRALIGAAGEVTNKLHGKLDGTCAAAVTYLKAAVRIAEIVDSGDGYTPVFIQFDTHRSMWTLRAVQYFTLRVGTLPTTWEPYDGKVGDANMAGIGD